MCGYFNVSSLHIYSCYEDVTKAIREWLFNMKTCPDFNRQLLEITEL